MFDQVYFGCFFVELLFDTLNNKVSKKLGQSGLHKSLAILAICMKFHIINALYSEENVK